MKKLIIPAQALVLTVCLLVASTALAGIPATFYVDQTAGNDSNTGLATDNAAKTVAWVNAYSRTNLALQSEDLATTWAAYQATVSVNADIAPDGTLTADRVVSDDTADASHLLYQSIDGLTDDTVYTYSIFLKQGAGTYSTWAAVEYRTKAGDTLFAFYDLATGALGYVDAGASGATPSAYDNGWYRVTLTASMGSGATAPRIYVWPVQANEDSTFDGDNTSYISVWGAQLEVGSLPTPYVPTVAAPVTASYQPGDSILFKRGEAWAEQIVVPSSGTSGREITFGSYGVGCVPTFDNVDLNGQTYVSVLSFSGACSGCPVLLMNYDQAVACLGGSGTRYDRAKAFFTAAGCSTGTLGDMNRCYTAAQGCGTGSYVDRWQCVFGVTGGVPGIMDYIRSVYGN